LLQGLELMVAGSRPGIGTVSFDGDGSSADSFSPSPDRFSHFQRAVSEAPLHPDEVMTTVAKPGPDLGGGAAAPSFYWQKVLYRGKTKTRRSSEANGCRRQIFF
jgi:hypothetical protein